MLEPIPEYREDRASEIAADIASKDSPLLQNAATKARQYANKRGLINSSMAAGAGQRAALDVAIPLASQQAGQEFQKNLTDQQTGAQKELETQRFGHQTQLTDQQTAAQKALSAQDFTQRGDLSSQEAGQTSDLSAQSAAQTADLSRQDFSQTGLLSGQNFEQNRDLQGDRITADRQMQADDFNFQVDKQASEQAFQEWQANTNLNATQQQQAGSMVTSMQNLYQNTIANINANSDLSAEARTAQLGAAKELLDRQIALTESLYSVNIAW